MSRGLCLRKETARPGVRTAKARRSSLGRSGYNHRRLGVEPLEDRCLLSGYSWNHQAAVNYADTWYNGRNTARYYDYSNQGGDCANFVSQCLIAGGLDLSSGPGLDSYGCIPSTTNLSTFLLNSPAMTQYTVLSRGTSEPLWFMPGDVAIFATASGTVHTVIAVTGDASNYTTDASHTADGIYSIATFFSANPTWTQCTYYDLVDATQPASTHFAAGATLTSNTVVNMRTDHSYGANAVASVPTGGQVTVLSDPNDGIAYNGHHWWKMQYGTYQGWCAGDDAAGNWLFAQQVNQPPSVPYVATPSGTQSGNVTISYGLADAESDLCSIAVQYSRNGGANWYAATQGSGGNGTSGLTSSVGGTSHTYAWNSIADLGNTNNSDVEIRITPTDVGGTGSAVATNAFTVNNGVTPSKVAFGQEPSNVNVNTAISPAMTVLVEDANGNLVSSSSAAVTLSQYSGPGSGLNGVLTENAVNGVATFSSVWLNTAGTYQISATSSGLTNSVSSSFVVSAVPTKLAFGQEPSNVNVNTAISPAMTVLVEDANGNLVSNSSAAVTLSQYSGPGSGLNGVLTENAVNGVAAFSSVWLNTAGTYQINATSSGLTNSVSSSFVVSAVPTKLAFGQEPNNVNVNTAISPAMTVLVEDANGNLVSSSSASVTLSEYSGPGSGLNGVLTANAVNGVATFSSVWLNTAGTYQITATGNGLTNAVSNSFVVSPMPTRLAFGQQPTNVNVNTAISPAMAVLVEDASGNLMSSSSAAVTLSMYSGPGSGLNGVLTENAVNGVATFSSVWLNTAGTYQIDATSSGLTNAVSNTFVVSATMPDLTVSLSHVGNFRQGDTADAYSIAVGNVGSAATTGTVTVTDTLPTGLTPTAADNGTSNGWTLSTNGQTVTGTRGDALTAGNYYTTLIVTVAVASNAPASVTNTVTVAGGGETNTTNDTASDLTSITPADTAPPTVSAFSAANVTAAGGTTESFTVTYADNVAVNVSTLDSNDIRVTGPDGYSQPATFLSLDNSNNGTPRTATYQITAPGGTWDATDDGTYSLIVQAGQVADTSGNYMATTTAGTFAVNISVPPSIASLSAAPNPVSVAGDLTLTANGVANGTGTVTLVDFYWDVNANGLIDAGEPLVGGAISGGSGWTCTFEVSELPIGANSYLARAEDNRGLWSNTVSTTATTIAATPTVTVRDAGGTYNGSSFAATALVAGAFAGIDSTPAASLEGVTPTLTYYAGASASGSGASAPPKNAGTYTVVASFAGSADYTSAQSAPSTFIIAPATVTATVAAANKAYDGNTTASITGRWLGGVLGSDQVSLAGGMATFATKSVGTGKPVTVSGLTLTGTDWGDYLLSSTTAATTANITARTLTVTAVGANKVYDGTTAATVTLSDNRVPGDVLTDNYTAAAFADNNVGTGKPISVTSISISGADAGNYQLASTAANAAASITPRTLTVTAAGANKIYDGTTAATATLSDNRVSGDALTDACASAAFGDKNVGTGKVVSASGISISGTDAGNYQLASTTASTTASVTALPITVTAMTNNKTYDGTTSAPPVPAIAPALAAGDAPNFVETYDNKNVGTTKTLTPSGTAIDGNGGANYSVTFVPSTAGAITPRTLTVTATGQNKVYDGTTQATVTLSDNRVVGDSLTDTYAAATFADPNAGMGKTVTVTGVAISGPDQGNYTLLDQSTTTTAAIDRNPTLGPVTSGVTVTPSLTHAAPAITAVENDFNTGDVKVTAAEYFVDAMGTSGKGIAMKAQDGKFSSVTETVVATMSATTFAHLPDGPHTIYVHAKDATGTWGSRVSTTFTKDTVGPLTSGVTAVPNPGGTATVTATVCDAACGNSNVVAAEYFIDKAGTAGKGTSIPVGIAGPTVSVSGTVGSAVFAKLKLGNHKIFIHGKDAAGNWGTFASAPFTKSPVRSAAAAFALSVPSGSAAPGVSPAIESLPSYAAVAAIAGASSPQTKKAQPAMVDRLMLTSADWL